MNVVGSVLLGAFFLLLPLWVAIQAHRKDARIWVWAIGLSYLVPFAPLVLGLIAFIVLKAYEPEWRQSPTASSWNGCGTMFYGACGRRQDGSFITTLWFALFSLPLVPIQSYRVIKAGESSEWSLGQSTTTRNFLITEALTINLLQIIKIYLWLFSIFFFITLLVYSFPPGSGKNNFIPQIMMGSVVIWVIIGYFVCRTK